VTLEELQAGAGTEFLFHYADAAKADAIITDRLFVAGPRGAHGFGVYATDIAPVNGETLEDVIVHCFGGDAQPIEVNHAIAVRISALGRRFERTTDPYQWVLPTGQLELVHLDGFYVATLEFDGRDWRIVDEEE
jgi:hypothetical protein